MAKRLSVFMCGVVSYLAFFMTFVYAVAFIGNLYIPKSTNSWLPSKTHKEPRALFQIGELHLWVKFSRAIT